MKNILPLLFTLISISATSQTDRKSEKTPATPIPARAFEMADSIGQTRLFCPGSTIELIDSVHYSNGNSYDDQGTSAYFFKFAIHLKEDIVTHVGITITEDFNIKYISGIPDKSYGSTPCQILPRYDLWQIARNNGLRTKFRKCHYYIEMKEEGVFIGFKERKSDWDVDHYELNAITGEFTRHVAMDVSF
jgi:hypothetical protein